MFRRSHPSRIAARSTAGATHACRFALARRGQHPPRRIGAAVSTPGHLVPRSITKRNHPLNRAGFVHQAGRSVAGESASKRPACQSRAGVEVQSISHESSLPRSRHGPNFSARRQDREFPGCGCCRLADLSRLVSSRRLTLRNTDECQNHSKQHGNSQLHGCTPLCGPLIQFHRLPFVVTDPRDHERPQFNPVDSVTQKRLRKMILRLVPVLPRRSGKPTAAVRAVRWPVVRPDPGRCHSSTGKMSGRSHGRATPRDVRHGPPMPADSGRPAGWFRRGSPVRVPALH